MIFTRSGLLACGAVVMFAAAPAIAQESSDANRGMGGMHQHRGQADGEMQAGGRSGEMNRL